VGVVTDETELIVTTLKGQAIRFPVGDVRPTGLGAGGMRAVKLQGKQDRVVGAGIADERANVWVCTDTGVAKSTPVIEYPVQGRGGQGVITMKLPKDATGLAAAAVGRLDDHLVLVTTKRKPKYMRVSLAPQGGRNTKGDYVISMGDKEVVARVVPFAPRVEPPENGGPVNFESAFADQIIDEDGEQER
jgi:DNA gyrase subunit A